MTWAEAVPLWVTLAFAFLAVAYFRRHGGGRALEELERANGVLERRVNELEKEIGRLTAELAAANARTDVSLAITPVLEALKLHEDRASERTDRTLAVLGLIADRLGPEAEAA